MSGLQILFELFGCVALFFTAGSFILVTRQLFSGFTQKIECGLQQKLAVDGENQ
jgi:hypothetical protein